MKIVKKILATSLLACIVCGGLVAKEVNFKGETIEWIIPYQAGGGADKWARFYAPFLSQNLPGQPIVVIKNMPGGGTTKGSNFFAARASKDGLTILGTSGSVQVPYLLDDRRVRYDYKDWNAVLASPSGGVVYVPSNLGVKNIEELVKLNKPLRYGSQGPTTLDLIPLLTFEILGLDVKPIFGMKGRNEGRLALLRGEVTIDYQTSSSYLKNVLPTVKIGEAIPLFSFGVLDANGELQRDPTFPDLPHFGEVYEQLNGKKLEGEAFEAWKTFYNAGFSTQKMIMLPKGVSQDVIDAYTKALEQIVVLPKFKEISELNIGVYEQMTGAKAEELKDIISNTPEENKKWMKEWLTKNYKVRF